MRSKVFLTSILFFNFLAAKQKFIPSSTKRAKFGQKTTHFFMRLSNGLECGIVNRECKAY